VSPAGERSIARRRRLRWIGPLWRWHRRAGLLAALLIALLAITGVLLNHTDALALAERPVEWRWVHALYGDRQGAERMGFAVGTAWVSQAEDEALFLDDRAIGRCAGALLGALQTAESLVIACSQELLLTDSSGNRIDALGSASGLDGTIEAVGVTGAGLLVQMNGRWRTFDIDTMKFAEAAPPYPEPARPQALPEALQARLDTSSHWLDWERLLLDLHSGRLFGRFGPLVMDLAAVLSLLLAFSGVAIWGLRRNR